MMAVYPFDILSLAKNGGTTQELLDLRPFVRRAEADDTVRRKTRHEQEAEGYEASDELRTAVNTAIALGQPILLSGAPGTGKTQAAYWIALELELGTVLEYSVKSTSTSRDLLYDFDAVRYMAASMRPDGRELPKRSDFITNRVLKDAFEADTTRVVLIDEIDKAPRDFPNDLLRELDQWVFEIEEARETVGADPELVIAKPSSRPIVVITSNGERPLPDAFLRRCVYHHIELDEPMIRKILNRRRASGDFAASDQQVEAAVSIPERLRQAGIRPPGVAELLAWLAVLDIDDVGVAADVTNLSKVPHLEVLVKSTEDQNAVRAS